MDLKGYANRYDKQSATWAIPGKKVSLRSVCPQYHVSKKGAVIEIMGPTGFDSETSGDVSMPSAGIQLVNLMTQLF